MKARMTAGIGGGFYWCPSGPSGYQDGVKRGDVVDLDPAAVLHELKCGRVELTLDGPIGRAYEKPSPTELLAVEREIAIAQEKLAKAAGR